MLTEMTTNRIWLAEMKPVHFLHDWNVMSIGYPFIVLLGGQWQQALEPKLDIKAGEKEGIDGTESLGPGWDHERNECE